MAFRVVKEAGRAFPPMAWTLPQFAVRLIVVRAGGCIDNVEFAKSLRCSLLEISDQIQGKLRQAGSILDAETSLLRVERRANGDS